MTVGAPFERDRFSKYFGWAVAAHVLFVAVLALVPSEWLGQDAEWERDIMYISLGGAPGPRLTGMNPISSRPVQEATAVPVRPQHQAPVEKAPVMAIPEKAPAKPAPPTKTPIQTTTEKPTGRTPIRGAEVREGQARIETGAVTSGTGLSLGGGEQGTGGETNLADFCCPAYMELMLAAINRNWKQNQGATGINTVRFIVERDGRITSVELVKPSGLPLLDRASQVAIMHAKLPQLPKEFTEPRLILRLNFEYKR
ncbi:MAG: TonB family protein [Vicinamibacterales bacterium]